MNKKLKINLFIAVLVTAISIPVIGQNSAHEFSVYGGGGLGTLTSKTSATVNDKDSRFGGIFGVGYTYYISPQFGLQTGVEYSIYSNKLSVSTLEGRYNAKDNDLTGDPFDFRYKINGYQETLKAGYLQIPIMAEYLNSLDDKKSFFISAGMKIGFAVNNSFDNELSSLSTEGYYANTDVVIAEDSPDLGFGQYSNLSSDGDLKLKTAFIASIETGIKWRVAENMSLYTGVYFDYGLNNVNKEDNKHLIEYNQKNPSEPILNSAVESIESDSKQLVEKLNMMSLGIKLKLSFNL